MKDLKRASFTWKRRKAGAYDGTVKGVRSGGHGEQIHAFAMKPSFGKPVYWVGMTIARRHNKWEALDWAFYQFRARTLASVKKKANSLLRNQGTSFARVHRVKSFTASFLRPRPEQKARPRGHPGRGVDLYFLRGR